MIRAIHYAIVAILASEALYCGFQVMVALRPEGQVGPLFMAAATIPHELLVARRLYAIEGWIAAVGLALYLAATEIGPRLAAERRRDG
ncbi:MAG: hypothetical protein H6737_06640 [Alphaproteobacteria bacterium]|nr:hypothetical protein [Alphaproteobacteria bacterium]